jgi:hypothetical protein
MQAVTGYVAVEPGVTVAVSVVKEAPDPEPAESTSNCIEFEAPPPGAGVCTTIPVIPAEAISLAVTCAVSWVALTNCVVRAVLPE